LWGVDFGEADLTGANLTFSDLLQASFGDAILRDANFTSTDVDVTELAQAIDFEGIILPGGGRGAELLLREVAKVAAQIKLIHAEGKPNL
jgi:uncharacterized protein YjbI with pentapeptide repeats